MASQRTPPAMRYRPNAKECALLLLRLIEAKEEDRGGSMTRVRLSEITLKRLWDRKRLIQDFLLEVEEWLLVGGWALVFAGETYGAVKVDAVSGWPRVTSKRLSEEIEAVTEGTFDFSNLERLLQPATEAQEDE